MAGALNDLARDRNAVFREPGGEAGIRRSKHCAHVHKASNQVRVPASRVLSEGSNAIPSTLANRFSYKRVLHVVRRTSSVLPRSPP